MDDTLDELTLSANTKTSSPYKFENSRLQIKDHQQQDQSDMDSGIFCTNVAVDMSKDTHEPSVKNTDIGNTGFQQQFSPANVS